MEKQNERLVVIGSVFLVVQLILDFTGARIIEEHWAPTYYLVAKGIKIAFLLFMVFILAQRKKYLPLYGVFGLGIIVLMGQWSLYGSWRAISWIACIREWMLYSAGIVMAFFFQSLYAQPSQRQLQYSLRFLIYVILVICFFVYLGFFFDIPLFKTYFEGDRFGYIGILHKSITATYFFIGSIALSYYYTYRLPFFPKWIFYILLVCSFLVGTKGIYLFNGLFFMYLFLYHQLYKKKAFYRGVFFLFFLILVLKNRIIETLRITYELFHTIYSEYGLITSLMSFRNQMLIEKTLRYKERWGITNYFFGGKIQELGLFEMSIVDLYSFVGCIGTIYVFYLYYKGVGIKPRNRRTKQYIFFCYLSILIISIFAGQLFVNFSSIFFILWVLFLINNDEIVKKTD